MVKQNSNFSRRSSDWICDFSNFLCFFGNIEKFSSLNPVVTDKVSDYYKNQTSENQNFSIDSNYSINARFLNISKFNETANDSNKPSGNKTIIILPPEPRNN